MATLIPITQASQSVDGGTIVEAFIDAVDPMSIPSNDGLVTLEVYNPTGGDLSFSFAPSASPYGRTLSPEAVVIAAGETRVIGPFPPTLYNQTDGTVSCGAEFAGLKVRGTRI
jgi:hypothetical protein